MSTTPADLRYASTHEWARLEADGIITVGITDHAQQALGDIVYLELPQPNSQLSAGQIAGVVESVKAASDYHAPVSGKVTEVNEGLTDAPEGINSHPYQSWFYRLQPDNPAELEQLLDADAYNASCSA
ncbi:glycine cleavage system protein GcvH [Thiopseudomonas acetoxidans]|uniref:Glycine cleavage system H protein n=1 Tax=Thiopseudomonas acetoxidans TaxID=3041622 RepID=A0ABT7SR63_9GAMM|nr:glycine cleavage system protein GcvH [Thiopseudomonas sp. CY1220]MDM7858687.1 glycine cleavage system protein GcvH [Thiopseudomonas sp. CY1220]